MVVEVEMVEEEVVVKVMEEVGEEVVEVAGGGGKGEEEEEELPKSPAYRCKCHCNLSRPGTPHGPNVFCIDRR